MGKYVVSESNGKYHFNLVAGNGEKILSSQMYASKKTALAGIASVTKNAPIAPVENQTEEGYATEKNPKFEVYADKKGEFRFRLKAANGQNIGASEGYTTLKGCMNGIKSVQKNADSKVVDAE